ncbi:SpoIIE family protein phosphatase/ATP-binding protein [Streptomyces sp. WMMC940]|uniref:SpoIIE family protein phosphatase/ATP-binding protein n=1 Tax=Streptomyces sp. WMMC940 TaxID=3015153 RepID=UPI0022B6477E|nr:SpoIIE family protein phosphatase/ATP-binding protein [Streptomyces sp. WMMC940]MCZ7456288.1 SpoIIE family protein phosphatase [Streptomyces sp. WMMC940]
MRTVASQVFVLQIAVVVLLVVAAVVALLLQSRSDAEAAARDRSLAVAETFAQSPGTRQALKSPDPTELLQPRAEAVRKATGVDFVVVTNTDAIRYTHPLPDRIGNRFVGNIQPALGGAVVIEWITGTIGPLVQAIVPVVDTDGTVIGTVTSGVTVENVSGTANQQLPVVLGAAGSALVLATGGTALISRRLRRQTHGLGPTELSRMYDHHDAVLHAVREGVIVVDGNRRLVLANDEARRLLGLPPDAEGRPVSDLGITLSMDELLRSGRTATDEVHLAGDRMLAVNQRSTSRDGWTLGSVATLRDTTELQELSGRADMAHSRLRLLYDAGLRIGSTLDVVRTAEELTDFAVPQFADFATVDLLDQVLRGEAPVRAGADGYPMRRIAVSGVRSNPPIYPLDSLIDFVPATPQATGFRSGRAILEADMTTFAGWQEQDPARARKMVHYGLHSMISVPLLARGEVLGVVTFWRSGKPKSFDDGDVSLAEELVARAALAIDNARRYTREHTMAVTLQRSLLPSVLPGHSAVEVAHRYLPAHAGMGGVGGDWFDVIQLSGARVAMIVGDVVGHGLHAAATMGRLRTAVHNFAALDLSPDELLWHLDELVTRIDHEESGDSGRPAITGATCLYMIYDPISRGCVMARAGHLEPALVQPDGSIEFPELPAAPPLGLGGLPFETAERLLPEGSRLVLFTDGLIENRERDIDEGLRMLREALAAAPPTPEGTCGVVLDALLPDRPSDDIALLVARTRVLDRERVADWDVPEDPAAVSSMREAVTEKLGAWGLDDLVFTTELILSELITNAIRYTSGPIRLRLVRDRTLICEVADSSSTAPHLRHAATMDEGGRGLFLVAQFAERWGTRYTSDGKVIWAEQPLSDAG